MRANTSYSRNRDRVLRHRRRTTLTTKDGQRLTGLNKRYHRGLCEICLKDKGPKGHPVRLEYHHWDADKPSKGIWVCRACHVLCERIDTITFDNIVERYRNCKLYLDKQDHE